MVSQLSGQTKKKNTRPETDNRLSRALRGAGDTMPPLMYTIVAQWIIRLPVAYLLAFTFKMDIYGIWITLIIFSALQGTLTVRKFAQGHWKSRRI